MNAQQFANHLKQEIKQGNRTVAKDGSVSPVTDNGFRFKPKKK